MNRGIIMEIKKSYAIALNDNGIMEKIAPKKDMKIGQKIFYFEDDLIKASNSGTYRYNNFIKSIGAIAALFLIVFTFFHTMKSDTAYAVVSLDINPSIQIEADNKLKIIRVEGVNNDGKNIDFTDVKGISLDEGIQKIKEKLIEKKYLDTNREVLVGFAFIKNEDNSAYEKDIKDVIQSTFNTEKVTYVKGDKEDVDEAKTKGISLGRYEASLVVDESTKNKIDVAPVKEITASIKDKENVTQWDAKDEKNSDVVTPATNSNSDAKPEKTTVDKPVINGAADNSLPNVDSGKATDNPKKEQKDDGVLNLQPEVPVQNENDNKGNTPVTSPTKDDNTINIGPDNGTIVNNPTSGKIQEDPNKTIQVPKTDENTANKTVKN
ncbi:anti-sigma-I factor RsgI family protein [Clostridium beijerinckii]|uniref:anti-sigma-I factor RsgI family protein n=1 Tax=Clostridium beijerinckii TaxID=1520 RepID=UPI00098C3BB7|nr:anti-sigma-I factor RsgI [Clostridium beijerinckii]